MRRALAALCAAALGACDAHLPRPAAAARAAERGAWLVDVTELAGVEFVHQNGATAEKHLPETMGAGAAVVDVDEDGDLDLYFVQGGPMRAGGDEPGSFAEPAGPLPSNRLFLNEGNGRFRDATARSGDAADTGYGMGVAVGDANGDGHVDFYVTNVGADKLLLGDGRGAFRDGTAESGIHDERWTSGATFFDADGDGDLDLYVGAYVLIDVREPEWCGDRKPGWRCYCHPDRYAGLQDRFWRNRGDGTFEDATESAGLADNWGKALGVISGDFDRDGDLDLYVANDSTENRLWENDGRGRFTDATLLSGTGVDAQGLTEASMGLASGDVDGDLDLDLVTTNFDDESATLLVDEGGLLFRDGTAAAGLEALTRLPVGFGTLLVDLDHDGDLEWSQTSGHIIDNIDLYHDQKTHAQRGILCENRGDGRFAELVAEAGDLRARFWVGRGLYSGDLDGDGDLDLVLTQCGGRAAILRNERGGPRALFLRGLPAGTLVEIGLESGRKLLREAGPQPSYLGACAADVHVGLADDRATALGVRAPYRPPQRFELPQPLASGTLRFARDGSGVRLLD